MKNEEHVRDLLVAYLSGNLDEQTTSRVAGHLGVCGSCGRELDSLRKVWLSLGSVPDEKADPRMAERFRQMLNDFGGSDVSSAHAPARGWLDWISPPHPAVQFALVLVLFAVGGVAGGLVGYRMHGDSADATAMVQLREEVRSVNRLLIVSLLQQQSATERLQGVSRTYKLDQTDPEVTGALLQTLNQDPNVNVRLAALDAVSRRINQPEVREGLLRSLGNQSSPMIQLAVVDLVVRSGMKESTVALTDLMNKPGVNDVVKKRVEEALQQLNI